MAPIYAFDSGLTPKLHGIIDEGDVRMSVRVRLQTFVSSSMMPCAVDVSTPDRSDDQSSVGVGVGLAVDLLIGSLLLRH